MLRKLEMSLTGALVVLRHWSKAKYGDFNPKTDQKKKMAHLGYLRKEEEKKNSMITSLHVMVYFCKSRTFLNTQYSKSLK